MVSTSLCVVAGSFDAGRA